MAEKMYIHNNQSIADEDEFIEFIDHELDDQIKLEFNPNDFGENTNNTLHQLSRTFNMSDSLLELANAKRADEKFELVSLIRSKYELLYGKNVDRAIKEASWKWILEECLRRGHCWAVGKEANYMRKSKWPGIKSDALKRYNEELVTGKERLTPLDKYVLEFISPETIRQSVATSNITKLVNRHVREGVLPSQIVLSSTPREASVDHNKITDINADNNLSKGSRQVDQSDDHTKSFSDPASLAAFLWEKSAQEVALTDNPPAGKQEDIELLHLQKQCWRSKLQRNRFQARYYRLKSCLVKRQLEQMVKRIDP